MKAPDRTTSRVTSCYCLPLTLIILLLSQPAISQQPQKSPNSGVAQNPSPNGQLLFDQRCALCHGAQGQGVNAVITFAGPSIQAVHNPGDVMMAMEVGPSHMPSFAYTLTIEQMNAIADYVTQRLAVIPLSGGDIGEGGRSFRRYCAPCHQTAVRGGALQFAGTNAPDISDKSPALIAGAIRWGPGTMPSFPSSVITDQQLASIVKYIQFVQHPPNPGGTPMNWFGPVAEGFVAWLTLFGVIVITGWIEKGGKG